MMDSRSRFLNSPKYAQARETSKQRARQRAEQGTFEGRSLILFNSWKSLVDENIVQTAGYNLEHSAVMLGDPSFQTTRRILEQRFENEWTPEDVAQEIIQAVDEAAVKQRDYEGYKGHTRVSRVPREYLI